MNKNIWVCIRSACIKTLADHVHMETHIRYLALFIVASVSYFTDPDNNIYSYRQFMYYFIHYRVHTLMLYTKQHKKVGKDYINEVKSCEL